jgi:hypothetical protein
MKKRSARRASVTIPLGCFGSFLTEDPICRSHCAIRIRCAIEKDQEIFLEVLKETAAGDDMLFSIQ